MIQREHILQKHVKLFVQEAVWAEHEFWAFDRGEARGFRHMREKMRGVTRATPDTLLQVDGLPDIWCELKWPPNQPTADQYRVLARLRAIGRHAFWDTSVQNYHQGLKDRGVRMRPNAHFLALHHDAAVLSEIAKAEARSATAKASYTPPRKSRATAGKIRRAHAAGVWSP